MAPETRIILASASPRRKKIFRELGFDFEIIEPGSSLEEEKSSDPVRMAVENSIAKTRDVSVSIHPREETRYLVSGFDTIVFMGKKVLGKPGDMDQARSFIEALSGRWHRVVTGICIIDSKSGSLLTGHEVSEVRFRRLNRNEINSYLEAEYVLDKAGAYNIAGPGAWLIEEVKGCMFNIVGVPVFKYLGILRKFDYKFLHHSKE